MFLFPKVDRWQVKRKPRANDRSGVRFRLWLMQMLVILAFTILTVQLWRLQVVEGSIYRERAEANRVRLISVPAARGVVYDREGRLLVENHPTLTAAAVPADMPVSQQEEILAKLEPMLRVPAAKLESLVEERRATGHIFTPVALKAGLDAQTAFILEERHAELPGVTILAEPRRRYLTAGVMAHVLGYTGRISSDEFERFEDQGYHLNDTLGKTGVERSYERELRGRPGREQLEIDATGRRRRVLQSQSPEPGNNLVLNIDAGLQEKVQEFLTARMGPSRYAAAVVANPRTGEVLALASVPTYDNNAFSDPERSDDIERLLDDHRQPLINYAMGGAYPPGSIFKMVTGTAALQEGVATPQTIIISSGSLFVRSQFGSYEFKEWRPGGLGVLNFYRAVAMSSDVYFYHLAGGYGNFTGLGIERLAPYARMYGLGSLTDIDLPDEADGLVADAEWKSTNVGEDWTVGDSYNMGIGQGYLLTSPIQMMRAVSALANGGELLQPQVVREIRDGQGNVVRGFEKKVQGQLTIAEPHLRAFIEGMRQAVTSGTATSSVVPGITVASKTGTAEFGTPRPGRIYDTHGWTMSFAPLEDPEVAVVVFVQLGTGSFAADPIAGDILRYYFGKGSSSP